MKKVFFLLLGAVLICGLFSFNKLQNAYNNIFDQLGLDAEIAGTYIDDNIIGGSTSIPRTKLMVKLAMNKRVEAVKEIGLYVKAYVKSPEFAQQYATIRAEAKPEKPTDRLYQTAEFISIYKEELRNWEEQYPASVNVLLQKRLKHFLQLTADIDFNAKLVKYGSKMIFADPALEAKDDFWKSCFRSGKPTVDAARAFAHQWLQELNKELK